MAMEGLPVVGWTMVEISAGDLVIVPPYTLHRYTIPADCDCRNYCLCFDTQLLYDTSFATALDNGEVTLPRIVRDETCAACVREAFAANETKAAGWVLRVVGALSLCFGRLWEIGAVDDRRSAPTRSVYGEMFA